MTDTEVTREVDKAVAALHQKSKTLEPDYLEVLRENYSNKQGWQFVNGPGNAGWEYFVDKISPLHVCFLLCFLLPFNRLLVNKTKKKNV